MAKREILFNDEVYSIEESVIEASLAEMKSRLVDDYSGSGTTIVYDGTTINVDSAKLATAASNLAATLNGFAGSGASIVVNGVTYGIDSAKLNSAKENMSGTLGEMAGVVEEEDELAGTWVIKNNPGFSDVAGKYSVDFVSNNITFNLLEFIVGSIGYIYYDDIWIYESELSSWTDDAYKTITITSKLSEVTNGEVLLTWLKANATKQEENQTESVIGTWVFNDGGALDNLSNSTTPFDVEFMCNGKAYGSMKCDEDSGGEGMWSLYYVKTPTNIDEAYGWGIGWYDQTYRTINISSEPTDETFIAWLKANATKQTTVEPEVPEEPTTDELAGTWVFNDNLDDAFVDATAFDYSVNFTSNDENFIRFALTISSNRFLRYYRADDDQIPVYKWETELHSGYYVEGNEKYKTFTITSKLSEVTNGEALLTWLKANATKQINGASSGSGN